MEKKKKRKDLNKFLSQVKGICTREKLNIKRRRKEKLPPEFLMESKERDCQTWL